MAAPAFATSLAAVRAFPGARAHPGRRTPSSPAPSRCFSRRTTVRAVVPVPDSDLVSAAHLGSASLLDALGALHVATKGDIGPLTNVDIESTGLVAAIGGGSLLAALIIFVLIRF
jgi:hypothetical protein